MTTLLSSIVSKIKENGKHSEIQQLTLDDIEINKFTDPIKKEIQKCGKIQFLSLNDCKLSSLDNFPKLPKLTILELGTNNLTDKDIKNLVQLKELKQICLQENNIQKIDSFNALAQNKNIIQIQLASNPVTQVEQYRQKFFKLFPNLEILDGKDSKGQEIQQQDFDEDDDQDDDDDNDDDQDDQVSDDDDQSQDQAPKKKMKNN